MCITKVWPPSEKKRKKIQVIYQYLINYYLIFKKNLLVHMDTMCKSAIQITGRFKKVRKRFFFKIQVNFMNEALKFNIKPLVGFQKIRLKVEN